LRRGNGAFSLGTRKATKNAKSFALTLFFAFLAVLRADRGDSAPRTIV